MAVPPPPAKAAPASGSVSNVPEWSVGDLASALKRTLEDAFGHVRLRGEISGFRGQHGSGHAYFSLKDGSARIDAVVWKGTFNRLRQRPQEGLEVVATGRITTFPGKSSYQIVIETLEPAGIGAWMALLEERKRLLAAEGLFAAERKRPIPYLPRVVGVVTSVVGAFYYLRLVKVMYFDEAKAPYERIPPGSAATSVTVRSRARSIFSRSRNFSGVCEMK